VQPPLLDGSPVGETQFFELGSHVKEGAQSALDSQACRQSPVGPHAYGEHGLVTPATSVEERPSSEQVGEALGTHFPPLHPNLGAQSASPAHDVLHFVASAHAKFPGQALGAPHAPKPSHTEIVEPTQPAPQLALAAG